jgi:hypothetical protein
MSESSIRVPGYNRRRSSAVTIFILAMVAILVALIVMRLASRANTMTSGFRPTRDRRSGLDRRQRRVRVGVDRRKRPRRQDDVASQYLARLHIKRKLD